MEGEQRDKKKGVAVGNGTRGGSVFEDTYLHPDDPAGYDDDQISDTDPEVPEGYDEFKRKAVVIIEEYFDTDDAVSAANELRDLDSPSYHWCFVKKLISVSMDRHDKEKEMAALLLSDLYSNVISPSQLQRGFLALVESCDDLSVDIPDAVDVLALFVARAIVDDILPPAFLTKSVASLAYRSKGAEVVKRAAKSYLSAPLHAEIILQRWGGSRSMHVEDVKSRINDLLQEYVVGGDKVEAERCIRELNIPFFHHEIVKRALILAMENPSAKDHILLLLKEASEIGSINSSQITKGFNRLIDTIDDLCLDIPKAKELLQSMIATAASDGWLCPSSLVPLVHVNPPRVDAGFDKRFKAHAISIIQEYFSTGDVSEVERSIEEEIGEAVDADSVSILNAVFVKKLVTAAMDRKGREKEMASVLLSSIGFASDDIADGFVMLVDAAEDISLDIPAAVEILAMFLARAVVDEVLAPRHLDEILLRCNGVGESVVEMARSLLKPRLSGERILRCWGAGGNSTTGWELVDVKEKIERLLEEYAYCGDVAEACRCIRELAVPFFHHEVVKKAMVALLEGKERLWVLLKECYDMSLISDEQMAKGFRRVADSLDDLLLDVPNAAKLFAAYVERAKKEGWIDGSF